MYSTGVLLNFSLSLETADIKGRKVIVHIGRKLSEMTMEALTGIRVLDLSRLLSDPYCPLVLTDMGA